jgi:hypothetical protein
MKEVYLNGKDVCIDADFFVDLGADRDTIEFSRKPMGEHDVKFKIGDNAFWGSWNDWMNRISIFCDGLGFKDGEIADQRLYELSKRVTQDMFGDLVVRKIVAWPEGDMPELMILIYEK